MTSLSHIQLSLHGTKKQLDFSISMKKLLLLLLSTKLQILFKRPNCLR